VAWGASTPATQKKPTRGTAPAKPAPRPEAGKWPIAAIRVEGNHLYRAETVIAVAGLRAGQLAGKPEFEAARDRLIASGVFETVGYRFEPSMDGKGYLASFQVVEVEPVYPVRFERLKAADADLLAALRAADPFFSGKIPATVVILKRHAKVLEDFFAARKTPEQVVGKVVADGPDSLAIVFRPAAPLPVVAQVTFVGNQVLPAATLLNSFAGVAYGTAYTEESFRQLLDSQIRPLYEARGRVGVRFPTITARKAQGAEGVAVTVAVEEGPSYTLGKVNLTGASAFEPRDLLDAARIQTGDIANFDEVNAGVDRIRKFYRRHGYLRVDARVDRKINPHAKTVDAIIRIEEGPQFVFGKLMIEGLDIHGEAAIRKMWTVKEGKPFNAEYPDYFLNQVREDGVFDGLGKTASVLKVDESAHTVDVTLQFGAAPPEQKKRRGPSF
jgi:outer membrane protein insertion porin family